MPYDIDLPRIPSESNILFNLFLSKCDGVAYTAQTAWIINATIKDNILFGSPYDPKRSVCIGRRVREGWGGGSGGSEEDF